MEKTIFIKIGVERLTIGKKFAREVFIGMPKNGKMIRIVAIGDEIRPSLLAKLHERSSEIFVTAFPEDPSEPDLVPLYEEHSRNEEQSPETAGFVNEKTLATERAEIVKGAEEFSSNRISEESSLSVKEIDSDSKQVGGDVSKTSSSERLIDEANKTSKKLFASDEASVFSAAEAPTEAFRFSNDPAATPEVTSVGLGYVPVRSPPATPPGEVPAIVMFAASVKRPSASTDRDCVQRRMSRPAPVRTCPP